ncbi:hypothetical protein J7I94_18615 [Streptomyces sp. ISL-12]|uniref:hypothetical protein n=1 Tax=Streptomyces sp. ISL-12 TaxID=2819177 RepID=UPI001BE4EF3D|nr:hypothetical protein [Streptomyces sp. ISL-12]MBT2412550.1 hypothetical protein [Streptomyces sp. ISL-12]
MVDEQFGLEAVAAEQAVVSVFEQIVAVLARQANAAIDDAALFRLADTLFAAFARAGEDGLTAEQIRAACSAFPEEVIDNRLGVLRKLGAIQPAFDKPYQREYRASFTSYVSMLFVQRMLVRGGQSELHQLLTMEKIRLEGGQGTPEEALEVVVGITTALRLLVAELVALTVGGTVEALRERAPLLWNAKTLIDQASAVHEILLEFWPELSRMCGELRSAIAAYEDASTNASARLMTAAGTTRALNLLPPEMWQRFARRATVDELAAVLADQVFDAPSPWHDVADLVVAVAGRSQPNGSRSTPPRSRISDGDEQPSQEWSDAEAERLAGVAEEVLSGRDSIAVEQLLSGMNWVTARRVLADLVAASNNDRLGYRLAWSGPVQVRAGSVPSWLTPGVFERERRHM